MERAALMEHRDRTEPWLTQKKPLRLTKVHALLERDHGVKASYATLRQSAIEELGWRRRKPTVRLAAHRLHERQPHCPSTFLTVDASVSDSATASRVFVFLADLTLAGCPFSAP